MRMDLSRAVGAYAGVMTLAVVWLGLAAVAAPDRFTTIDVQRINVREPDGTLRMVIASHAAMPSIVVGDHEYPHPKRPEAGMIFYNDEGIENGGLVFDGGLRNGRPTNGGSFTFDRYKQDQTLQLISTENGPDRRVGFAVNDRPDRPMDFAAAPRILAMSPGPARDVAIADGGYDNKRRIWLGRNRDGGVELVLGDPHGRPRLTLSVGNNGIPSVTLRDTHGRVTKTLR